MTLFGESGLSDLHALFMKNEIAGVPVTEELIERYPENATMEEGEALEKILKKSTRVL